MHGIPCTTIPVTLLALAATVPRNVLESACNQAEINEAFDMWAVNELLDRRAGHPGTSRLRSVVAADGLGRDKTKSKLEKRFLYLAKSGDLPMPSVNEWVSIPGEEMQCDFVWHRQRLVVEVDGWETHRTRKAFRDDRRRDQLLRVAGWNVLRFTSDDVDGDPDYMGNVVRTLLGGPPATVDGSRPR